MDVFVSGLTCAAQMSGALQWTPIRAERWTAIPDTLAIGPRPPLMASTRPLIVQTGVSERVCARTDLKLIPRPVPSMIRCPRALAAFKRYFAHALSLGHWLRSERAPRGAKGDGPYEEGPSRSPARRSHQTRGRTRRLFRFRRFAACALVARLHLLCSGARGSDRSRSSWPRSQGSSGRINSPHRRHGTTPRATRGSQRRRSSR